MDLQAYLTEEHGRASALAKRLEISPVLISQWASGVRKVPLERCVEIEKATERAVTCEELRPDQADYWAYLRDSAGEVA